SGAILGCFDSSGRVRAGSGGRIRSAALASRGITPSAYITAQINSFFSGPGGTLDRAKLSTFLEKRGLMKSGDTLDTTLQKLGVISDGVLGIGADTLSDVLKKKGGTAILRAALTSNLESLVIGADGNFNPAYLDVIGQGTILHGFVKSSGLEKLLANDFTLSNLVGTLDLASMQQIGMLLGAGTNRTQLLNILSTDNETAQLGVLKILIQTKNSKMIKAIFGKGMTFEKLTAAIQKAGGLENYLVQKNIPLDKAVGVVKKVLSATKLSKKEDTSLRAVAAQVLAALPDNIRSSAVGARNTNFNNQIKAYRARRMEVAAIGLDASISVFYEYNNIMDSGDYERSMPSLEKANMCKQYVDAIKQEEGKLRERAGDQQNLSATRENISVNNENITTTEGQLKSLTSPRMNTLKSKKKDLADQKKKLNRQITLITKLRRGQLKGKEKRELKKLLGANEENLVSKASARLPLAQLALRENSRDSATVNRQISLIKRVIAGNGTTAEIQEVMSLVSKEAASEDKKAIGKKLDFIETIQGKLESGEALTESDKKQLKALGFKKADFKKGRKARNALAKKLKIETAALNKASKVIEGGKIGTRLNTINDRINTLERRPNLNRKQKRQLATLKAEKKALVESFSNAPIHRNHLAKVSSRLASNARSLESTIATRQTMESFLIVNLDAGIEALRNDNPRLAGAWLVSFKADAARNSVEHVNQQMNNQMNDPNGPGAERVVVNANGNILTKKQIKAGAKGRTITIPKSEGKNAAKRRQYLAKVAFAALKVKEAWASGDAEGAIMCATVMNGMWSAYQSVTSIEASVVKERGQAKKDKKAVLKTFAALEKLANSMNFSTLNAATVKQFNRRSTDFTNALGIYKQQKALKGVRGSGAKAVKKMLGKLLKKARKNFKASKGKDSAKADFLRGEAASLIGVVRTVTSTLNNLTVTSVKKGGLKEAVQNAKKKKKEIISLLKTITGDMQMAPHRTESLATACTEFKAWNTTNSNYATAGKRIAGQLEKQGITTKKGYSSQEISYIKAQLRAQILNGNFTENEQQLSGAPAGIKRRVAVININGISIQI
ncbi:hypothetical protein ACFLQ1_02745, partial [Candidatus Auribacterota bacterium]